MTAFFEHLELLTSTAGLREENALGSVELWTSDKLRTHHEFDRSTQTDDIDCEAPWPSLLNEVDLPSSACPKKQYVDGLVDRLFAKPSIEAVTPSILATLSSNEGLDSISMDLTDTLGYDELDLISELLQNREEVAEKLDQRIKALDTAQLLSNNNAVPQLQQQDQVVVPRLDSAAARARQEQKFRTNAMRPLVSTDAPAPTEVLPNVYTSSSVAQGNTLSHFGSKYLLPINTTREYHEEYEEVTIPPAKPVPPRMTERLIPISELDELASGSFPGYSSLNRIQSIVFPIAYQTNENMLVCAPTGAGKTDVAMLTILRVLDQHRNHEPNAGNHISTTIRRNDLKIIYVAPMKALASEIVRKLGSRLKWLSIKVSELTGDMQMTKAEIAETQIIVTTPEKWDVVTRKPTGEGELAYTVKLLIIDEVHLLNEERGAVIETIVARTLRQVETTQSLIRIVGLSATLPNYVDVADFLRVSRYQGLFYFDSSFRPIPLEQHFIGIKGKPNSPQSRRNLDRVAYEKVSALVAQGHQVMVFVHARKETVKTALALKDAALSEGAMDDFSCAEDPSFSIYRREMSSSRNKELKQLFDYGFGIHHAGMLRADRNIVERAFQARTIKVLCCTATLAWGVNLPAHAVVIKGTQVYDSAHGKFVDLSVLDVLQIFGRAGRPGLESSGEGYILTTEDMLTPYLEKVTSQNPIESQFIAGMTDSLNAEIALGTVSTIEEAVQWVGYTYLFVRMRKNPFIYGMDHDILLTDPNLGIKRYELAISKAKTLAAAKMISYNESLGTLTITDLGRIAAKYYIRTASIEIFNKELQPKMGEADIIGVLCMSTEFEQIQLRDNEIPELDSFMSNKDIVPCEVKGAVIRNGSTALPPMGSKHRSDTKPTSGLHSSQGKVNILLQTYISRGYPEDFALVSDMAYVAQNGARIIRALLEIALSRKWAYTSVVLLALSKAVEKRIWSFEHPLLQFKSDRHPELIFNLTRWADELSVSELAALSASDLGALIHMNERHGEALSRIARQFPVLTVTHELRPVTSDLLRIVVHLKRAFDWGSRPINSVEPFWLWVEDPDGSNILQLSHMVFRHTTESLDEDFVISITGGRKLPRLTLRYISDRWIGSEGENEISLDDLVMPPMSSTFTPILHVPFLSLSVLGNTAIEDAFFKSFQNLNAIQTHSYWTLVNSNQNALLCAPSGSGKSALGRMALLNSMLSSDSPGWALVLAADRHHTRSLRSEFRMLTQGLGLPPALLAEPGTTISIKQKTACFADPRSLLELLASRSLTNHLPQLRLVICENLELLDARYELAVSMLLHACQVFPVRVIGISTSLVDAGDVAAWLRVRPEALCNFRPTDRDHDLATTIQSFNIPHSLALFKTMAKPAHTVIRSGSTSDSSIIFVPSRALCKAVAADLITQCAIESSMQGYLAEHLTSQHLGGYMGRLRDASLVDYITRGIGIYHGGVDRNDRSLLLELYEKGIVRVMVISRDACWQLPIRADSVIVMGTQYVRVDDDTMDRQVEDYSLQEIVHMQSHAYRHMHQGRFHLFCQAEKREMLTRSLNEGIPLESSLHKSQILEQWYTEERKRGLKSKQDALDALDWTYMARRILNNPLYYDAHSGAAADRLSRLVDNLDATL